MEHPFVQPQRAASGQCPQKTSPGVGDPGASAPSPQEAADAAEAKKKRDEERTAAFLAEDDKRREEEAKQREEDRKKAEEQEATFGPSHEEEARNFGGGVYPSPAVSVQVLWLGAWGAASSFEYV